LILLSNKAENELYKILIIVVFKKIPNIAAKSGQNFQKILIMTFNKSYNNYALVGIFAQI
jgi:hypothetical protein